MGLKSCWEVVGPARDDFNRISKEIKAYLERDVEPVSSSVIWTMYMTGRSVDTARPTIMFCSKEANCRKRIRYAIEKSVILNELPSVRVGDSDRPPDFDHLCEESPVNIWVVQLCVDHDDASEVQAQLDILPAIQDNATTVLWPWEIQCAHGDNIPVYRQANNTSKNIFACRFFQDCFTLWKATAGGIFCSTDKTYATTISHGFPNISDGVQDNSSGLSNLGTILEGQQDNESFEFEYDIQEESDTDSDDEKLTELTSAASLSPEIMDLTCIGSLNLEHAPLVHPNDLTIYNESLSNKSEAGSLTEGLSKGSGTIPVLLDGEISSDQRDGMTNETHLANPLSDHEKTREVVVESPEVELHPHVTSDKEFHGRLYARRKELEIMELQGINTFKYRNEDVQDIRDGCRTDLNPIGKVVNIGISDHNLDYTLAELNNSISRLLEQMICQSDDFKASIPYSQKVSRVPIDTRTYAVTGSVSFIIGRLSGTPAFIQIPQVSASQELWKVQLDGGLQPGDSGSIVISAENGDIFGHIVYGSLKVGLKLCAAYILPMHKILDDIRDRLGIDLTSPLDIDDRRLFEYRIQLYLIDPDSPLLYMSSTHYDSSDKSHSDYMMDIESDRFNISFYADQYEEDFHGQGGI
ncbi:hypothetical protein DID88_001632 [Monilinia fructigena]|uniref:Uncharacterized protein n=1 Tax=Monilinia fructigena TaxID=38457 RepID=A0A395J1S3_9HELO|nr:hypothetical protein DID88_001632 [Monilinia fructigena]